MDDGVDLIIDFIGRDYFTQNLSSLRRDGTLIFLAFMSGPKLDNNTNLGSVLYNRLTIKGTTLRSRSLEYQSDLLQRFERDALGLIKAGKMSVKVHEVSLDSKGTYDRSIHGQRLPRHMRR